MKGFDKLSKRDELNDRRADYLRRIDCEAVLLHYEAENVHKDGDELVHSCIIDRVEPHHSHGDATPSARLNVEKKLFNCIGPGAWVMTPEGGKPIEEIRVGDRVLTHQGRYRPVTNTFVREVDEEVIEYRPSGSRPFLITKDHKMWTAKRNTCGRCSKPSGCRHVQVDHLGWNEASGIEGHVVARGKLTDVERVTERPFLGSSHGNSKVRVESVAVTPEFMRFAGYYLSEGGAVENYLYFTFSPDEEGYAEDLRQLASEVFGVETHQFPHEGALRVEIRSRSVSAFMSREFGKGASGKLLPEWAMTLPVSDQVELLRGLYRGDGSVSRNHQSVLKLANVPLIYQVWQILSRLDAATGIGRVESSEWAIKGRSGVSKVQGVIRWADDGSEGYRHINDKSQYPFRKTPPRHSQFWRSGEGRECVSATYTPVHYSGPVYDFEVEEDHSFVVEGVVSSNCWSYGGGDIFWLILQMEQKDHFHEIAPLLGQFLGDAVVDTQSFIEEINGFFLKEKAAPLPVYHEKALQGWALYHPYLETRGIDFETAVELKIGYDERTNRIVIPVYHKGKIVGWQKRSIPEADGWPGTLPPPGQGYTPKYLNPPGFPKHSVLYNLDRVTDRGERTILLVESPFSVIKAEALGIKNAVATFGASPSEDQLRQLRKFDKVYVWYDDDDAGYRGATLAIEGLIHYTNVLMVIPDGNKDLGDYSSKEEVQQWISENNTPGALALGILNPKGARRGTQRRHQRAGRG